jgi:serine/threonine protein kinase
MYSRSMVAGARSLDAGAVVGGRYVIEGRLGEGGMAIVYAARHRVTNKRCALKVVHPQLLARPELVTKFLDEARIAGRVGSHPHIVELFDADVDDDGVPFIAMELLEGETLAARIDQRGPLPLELAEELLDQLAEALDAAHGAGVVHRDLKLTNIFVVQRRGRIELKILDFGIAKVVEGLESQTATQVGTPAYCAPEQLGTSVRAIARERGFRVATGVSPATDVWALGFLAWSMLTGQRAEDYWQVDNFGDLLVAIAFRDRAPPRERAGASAHLLPEGFDSWFLRCTAHDAADRFPTAGEAVTAFHAALAQARGGAPEAKTLRVAAATKASFDDASRAANPDVVESVAIDDEPLMAHSPLEFDETTDADTLTGDTPTRLAERPTSSDGGSPRVGPFSRRHADGSPADSVEPTRGPPPQALRRADGPGPMAPLATTGATPSAHAATPLQHEVPQWMRPAAAPRQHLPSFAAATAVVSGLVVLVAVAIFSASDPAPVARRGFERFAMQPLDVSDHVRVPETADRLGTDGPVPEGDGEHGDHKVEPTPVGERGKTARRPATHGRRRRPNPSRATIVSMRPSVSGKRQPKLVSLAAVLMVLVATPVAIAGNDAEADRLFNEGIRLLDDGRSEEACAKFLASMREDPSLGAAYQLGKCYESRGELVHALDYYRRALKMARAEGDQRQELLRGEAAGLVARVPTLQIVLPPDLPYGVALEVALDGVPLGRDPERTRPLDPGNYEITARARGHRRWSTRVTLEEKDRILVEIPTPEELPRPEDRSAYTVSGIALTAVGGGAMLVGALLGSIVLVQTSNLERQCADRVCPTGSHLRGIRGDLDRLAIMGDATTGLLIAGAATAASGVVLMTLGSQAEVQASVGPRGIFVDATF